MTNSTATTPARQAHLAWVDADDLQVNPVAQREFRQAWAQTILSQFDIDKFQVPHVNKRPDGSLFVMEGQHSTWAYRQYVGEGQKIQVWLYRGLSEEEEAEFFLSLNNKKNIDGLAKFKVGVTAGRSDECDIDRIVRANGCTIGKAGSRGITAVSALTTIYARNGAANLGKTLRVIRDSFDEGGFERPVLLGVAMVLARYSDVDEARLIKQLAGIRNGWKGLVQKTALIKAQMGVTQPEAAAAAVVEFYNAGRGGKKLPTWWHENEPALKAV